MNPNDIFWVARYAYNEVSPLVREGERLQIILDMGGKWPGVQVWIFPPDNSEITTYKSHITTKEQVDQFVATLQPLEAGIAA